MAGRLYVRTSASGTGPSEEVPDLGITIPTASGWLLLSASSGDQAIANQADDGQFSSRTIRDSQDLYDSITLSGLEWSKDGISGERADVYVADYMVLQDLIGDDWNLSSGRFTSPQGISFPSDPKEGELFYDTSQKLIFIYNSSTWSELEMAASPKVLLMDEVPASKYTYVGESVPGTAVSAAGWRIYRIDESKPGPEELIKLYANGSILFDQIWDDRLSLTYDLPV